MNKLLVSSAPHIRTKKDTPAVMLDVIIALLPALVAGVVIFGIRSLLVVLTCVLASVVSEFLFNIITKKEQTIFDFSAIVTGIILGLNLRADAPVWQCIIGAVFAIVVVKCFFGGLGQNFMNPALGARCFLFLCYAERMNTFQIPQKVGNAILNYGAASVDGISGATPLAALKAGETISLFDAFFGFTGGVIGETSAAMILLGAAYMVYRKVISLRIPLAYLLTFSVFVLLLGGHGFDFYFLACQLCTGGLMLGAFFMATDYVTSPITKGGQIVFGILLGILTGIFRLYGNNAEGVSYAIIIANLLVPLIEKMTMPRPFGKGGLK